jgi:hypothetical protein
VSKFEEVVVRIAYVAKLLIGLAGMVATALLGLSDLPAGWKFPLLLVATVAGAVGLYRTPNGPSLAEKRTDLEIRRLVDAKQEFPDPQ